MSRRSDWPAVLTAALLFAFSLYAVQRWLERGALMDVGGYRDYADFIRAGNVPYSHPVHMPLAYPPLALVPWLVASYMRWRYATSFNIVMGFCGAGCLVLIATALRKVEASAERTWAALLLFGISPLVLGSLFGTRYDLWPTLLALGGVVALVYDRPVLSGALLGLGFAAKLWPAVLLPLAIIYLWRRRGGRLAGEAVASFVVVAALCFAPFAILEPHGLWVSIAGQFDRPLQVESLGAAVLMTLEHLGMARHPTITSHGAQALTGPGARAAAGMCTSAEMLAVIGILIAYARRRADSTEALFMAAAATVAALVAFDKVLSPQYLIWIVPFVALASGRAGVAAGAFLLLALGLTQTWFPWNYWALAQYHETPWSSYLLARDLALVAVFVALAVGLSREAGFGRGTARSPAAPQASA